MKRYIYTTLLVFATLFCQASGVQNGWPTFYDTICAKPNQTINMADFESQILEILQNREDSLWSECCDVTVELEREPQIAIEGIPSQGWPDLVINTSQTVGVVVTYKRILTCSKIPTEEKPNMPPASLAMWYIFGDLLSEIETGKVTKVSDEATVTTLHKATFFYRFQLAFPDDILFKIKGDICFGEEDEVELSVDSAYLPYSLSWIASAGIIPATSSKSQETFYEKRNDKYLYPIICTATACKGKTRSDTIFIGKPTPTPEIDDLSCIAANETSFDVAVKEPYSQLSYYWSVENLESGEIVDTQQGASVTMNIPQNKSVRLNLRSSGGCRDTEMEPMILHRSLVSEAHHIAMESEPLCIFEGDTLRLSLSETTEDTLVWQIAGNTTMLLPYDTYDYPIVQDKDNVVVSVYAKSCPDNIITDTFNIREDFKVSLGTSPMCISVNESHSIRLASNGINPEVHWYGNGIELDTTSYSTKDSILLRLTNPGGQNLYVAVKAKECGRERDTLLVLRPKPEMPSLDPLSEKLTPCIPLGIADTIELRVQPQEGVKFNWDFSNTEKFYRIAKSDSHSIRVVTNLDLLDSEEDKTLDVNIYAYTEGCLNGSDTLSTTLYATGAGLGKEWNLIQVEGFLGLYSIGFSDDGESIKYDGFEYPFDEEYIMLWSTMEEEFFCVVSSDEVPLDLSCKVTSVERQCYSVYSIEVVDMPEQQDALFAAKKGGEETGKGRETESLQIQASFEKKDTPCSGIVLHPNPVHAGVQVKVEGICETESFTVECYSQQGKCLFRTSAKGDTFTIPTGSYAAGVYIIRIQPDGAATPIIKKLIII